MSQEPNFRGKKGEIVRRLRLGELSKAIAEALDTTVAYVDNVHSQVRKKYGIEFPPPQPRPPETQRPIVTNVDPRTVQQAAPNASNPPGLPPAGGPQISNVGAVTAPPAAAETKGVNPELERMRQEMNRIEGRVSEQEEALMLNQRTQDLLKREQRLSNEALLQKFVFDVCSDIREMWNNKTIYIEVMTKIFHSEPYKGICNRIAGMRIWSWEDADRRLPLVLEQIFDNTSPEFRNRRLASATILTDSIEEFIDYFDTHPRCPVGQMPGLPSETPGYWRCAENHVWFRPDGWCWSMGTRNS